MQGRALILRGALTLAVALAAGHLVHVLRPGELPGSVVRASADPVAVATGPDVPASASLGTALRPASPAVTGITSVAAEVSRDDPCAPLLTLTRMPGAMIDVALNAPCNGNQRVVLRHAGLAVTLRTDAAGRAAVGLPALQPKATVALYLGAAIVLGEIDIPEAEALRRFVFQWASNYTFSLRVSEGDAVFVGPNTAGDAHRKIIALGSPGVQDPLLAQVYTFPASRSVAVDVAVDLRVGPESCGRTLSAQMLYLDMGHLTQRDLPVSVPLCGTSGDILVLKNLAPDLKLATPN